MMIESCSKECCTNNKRVNKTIKDKQNDDRELQ